MLASHALPSASAEFGAVDRASLCRGPHSDRRYGQGCRPARVRHDRPPSQIVVGQRTHRSSSPRSPVPRTTSRCRARRFRVRERAVHREARQSPGTTCRGRSPAGSGDSGIGGEQLGLGWNPPGRRGSPQVDRSLLRPPLARLTVGQVIEVVGVPDASRTSATRSPMCHNGPR